MGVAPRAGAWIETRRLCSAWGQAIVAPRAGAWIETGIRADGRLLAWVAPRAGAWIETVFVLTVGFLLGGRPPRGGVD